MMGKPAVMQAMAEWKDSVAAASADTRGMLCDILSRHRDDLRTRYAHYLATDTEIARIVPDGDARGALTESFMAWISHLLTLNADEAEAFATRQIEVGNMMARIGLPAHAVSRAMRKLKLWFLLYLDRDDIPRDMAIKAMRLLIATIDTSVEIRETSYQTNRDHQSRIEEAYRLHALGQNLAMERERQRAALMEWSQQLMTALYQPGDRPVLSPLCSSDFGLWLTHKARAIFEGAEEIEAIERAMELIDRDLVPQLSATSYADRDLVIALISRLQDEVTAIKFCLSTLFESRLEIENGRDPLTHLLNRRFLSTVLMREVALQKTHPGNGFCMVMLDVDHFKAINDQYGHLAGDTALQNIAATVVACARPSDFVFRYGGEEIALVLVDCDIATAERVATRIRDAIADTPVILADGTELALTASLGVAAFEGDLDYEKLIARADAAVYAAKAGGRNRVVTTTSLDEAA